MLELKKVHDGYIVYRVGARNHAHFKQRSSANLFLKIINRGQLPKNPYLRKACSRVLTEEEYNSLKGLDKPNYINHKI